MISRSPHSHERPKNTDEHIIMRYMQRQKKIFGLDFNDLINFVFVLFERFPDVRRMWQDRLEYIQVDEFQDTSSRELKLINILSERKGNLFVVGDPDQNIYEWRGAKVEILVDFDRTHPGTQTIVMDRNYRSTARILKAANTLISHNRKRIKKDLYTTDGEGDEVIHMHAASEAEECGYIAASIKELRQNGYCYNDIAVLYRSGFLSRAVEQALMSEGIPYEIIGSTQFFRRMEIADALAYLKLVSSDDDDALVRIINTPRRRFGKVKLALLKRLAEESGMSLYQTLKRNLDIPDFKRSEAESLVETIDRIRTSGTATVSELLDSVLSDTGYEKYIRETGSMERLENLGELKKITLEFERSWGEELPLAEFLRQTALMNDYDSEDKIDRVKLMTIHAAKGLEFPVCFVAGMTDGIMPSSRTIEERGQDGLEEERRLCFVALTRAMRRLYLTDSEGTGQNGNRSGYRKLPSRFLFEIGEENYRRIGEIPKDLLDEARALPDTMPEKPARRPVGDRVTHAVFGPGVIESISEERGAYNIRFEKTGTVKPISVDYDFDAWGAAFANMLAQKRERAQTEREQRRAGQPEPAPEEPKLTIPEAKKPGTENRTESVDTDNLWNRDDVPHEGWECTGISDLGAPVGLCKMCGRQVIRYVHHMRHPQYPYMIGAGCVCAGRMEGDEARAAKREADFKSRESRRQTFIARPRKRSKNGNTYIKYKDEIFTILPDKYKKGFFKVAYKGSFTVSCPTVEEALSAAFDMVDK
jgi:DNA helicase-2/ATP-dependent DNA helicase PcrA